MSLYQQCGLKFYFSYLGGWREPPSAALTCGSITHEIVEHLYRLPSEERSLDRALELLREHGPRMLKMTEFRPFENDNSMKAQIRDAVENLFTVENPQEIVVKPNHLEMELTVEINGVDFFGKVDRFTQDGLNRVTDYKTGKSPGKYIEDKLAQPYLYALAFKLQHDIDVDEVELIFLNAKEVIRRPVEKSVMLSMGEKLAVMRAGSKTDIEASAWDAKVQRLCDYCSFQEACPARNVMAPKPGTDSSDDILRAAGLSSRSA